MHGCCRECNAPCVMERVKMSQSERSSAQLAPRTAIPCPARLALSQSEPVSMLSCSMLLQARISAKRALLCWTVGVVQCSIERVSLPVIRGCSLSHDCSILDDIHGALSTRAVPSHCAYHSPAVESSRGGSCRPHLGVSMFRAMRFGRSVLGPEIGYPKKGRFWFHETRYP